MGHAQLENWYGMAQADGVLRQRLGALYIILRAMLAETATC